MRSDRALPTLRRVDVQLGLSVGAAIALLLVALVAVLFFVAAHEAAEMLDRTLDTELEHSAFELAHGEEAELDDEPIPSGIAIRRIDADGTSHEVAGRWPAEGSRAFAHNTTALRLAFAEPGDHLRRTLDLPGGARLEGAASLGYFVKERREQLAQIGASLIFGLLGAMACRSRSSPLPRTGRRAPRLRSSSWRRGCARCCGGRRHASRSRAPASWKSTCSTARHATARRR